MGNIKTWTQQQDANPAKAYDFEYDRADQLRTAVWRTTDPTPTILKRYAYAYDSAGNRTVEQIDNAPTLSAYDNMNRLTSQTPGGTMRFAGTLNEAAMVTIQGLPATVTSDNRFERGAQVSSGTSQVIVKAKDYAGNERTNTYEVSISGSSKSFTFDANGNMTGDGTRTFEWDARNQLLAVVIGTNRTEFSYDGLQRRVRIVEKENGVVQSDIRLLWCDTAICEERGNGGATVSLRAFALGEEASGSARFFAQDHLGSTTEVTNSSQAMLARYAFDPWGRRSLTTGTDVTEIGYTGHRWRVAEGVSLTRYRAYDPGLGRWTSEDPIGLEAGYNLYGFVFNSPIGYVDPHGLDIVPPPPPGGKCESGPWKQYASDVSFHLENQWRHVRDIIPEIAGPTGGGEGDSAPIGPCWCVYKLVAVNRVGIETNYFRRDVYCCDGVSRTEFKKTQKEVFFKKEGFISGPGGVTKILRGWFIGGGCAFCR